MSEKCPLSSGDASQFNNGREFAEVCNRVCERLWDAAVQKGDGGFEPSMLISETLKSLNAIILALNIYMTHSKLQRLGPQQGFTSQ